ncbi:SSI family serine proteinase inhibitor [Streptomyces sp. NPDC091272]|uniref:SSI family serine proteinase inhibitor n=1 Tax=Streptomyces sp. NPDC091272 TaxID=3365981 RepID=UPI003803F51C
MTAVRTAGRTALAAAAVAAALLAGTGAGAGGATAADADREPRSGNWLYTMVIEGEDEEAVDDLEGTVLRCPQPPDTDDPESAEACARLAAVDGDLTRMKRADVNCAFVYQPVTAVVYGVWDGRRIAFAKNFPNPCVLDASTGAVFKPAGTTER